MGGFVAADGNNAGHIRVNKGCRKRHDSSTDGQKHDEDARIGITRQLEHQSGGRYGRGSNWKRSSARLVCA